MEKLKAIFLLILLWVLAYEATFEMPKSNKEYQENGISVYATITNIDVGIRGRKSYQCEYINATGQEMQAKLLLNKFEGNIGEVVLGYYLPDTPNEVYCPPSKVLSYGIIIFVDGIVIFFTLFLISALFGKS